MNIEEIFQRGLNLERLRSFLAVAQAGSVIAAAGGEQSRRSLMSRQIGELEKALGFDLFNRSGRSIEINKAGRELAILIASFLSGVEEVTKNGNRTETSLRIGAGASVFETLVFPQLRKLESVFPACNFEFWGFATEKVVDALHRGRIDLGIVRAGLGELGIDEVPSASMSFVLVGRRDFNRDLPNWSGKEFLSRVPLTTISGEGSWVQSFHRICRELEVTPRLSHRTETFGQVRDLIKAGSPGGILPTPLAINLPQNDFAIVPDKFLDVFTRPLAVVFNSRAAKVRDRLQVNAHALANLLMEPL